jgi:serine/threonine-protein kinase
MATDSSMTNRAAWAPLGMTLVERLGVGSVFEVARVRDERNRELIAKRIAPRAGSADLGKALERERIVLAVATSLRVACLPELVASGTDERGAFVVETIALGIPARELAPDAAPFLPAKKWRAVAHSTSNALCELHAISDSAGGLGIVHGDISPDNLFVMAHEKATFVDLSNATFRDAPTPALLRGRGTLPYAAPEIARNDEAPSQASDTYALAATLAFLAIGALTEAATDASRLLEVGTRGLRLDKLDQRTDLPARARAALASALRFEPKARLVSASDLARELSL